MKSRSLGAGARLAGIGRQLSAAGSLAGRVILWGYIGMGVLAVLVMAWAGFDAVHGSVVARSLMALAFGLLTALVFSITLVTRYIIWRALGFAAKIGEAELDAWADRHRRDQARAKAPPADWNG